MTACSPAAKAPASPTDTPTSAKAPPAGRWGGPWTSPLRTDHPLVGRIWDPTSKTFVERDALSRELASARFVLLGEKHDNPDHHRLQAEILAQLAAEGRRPSVVFEMVDVDQQAALDAGAAKGTAAVERETTWTARGWPFASYAPVVDAALRAGLRLVAGNYPRARTKALFHMPEPNVPEEERARLGLLAPLPLEHAKSLERELEDAHCGHPLGPMLPAFVLAQRLRDAQMAERLSTTAPAGPSGGAVLVAGTGHVRTDRGVPLYLRGKGAIRSVAFVEVRAGITDPAAYAEAWHATSLPFDAVWFTPAIDDADPCASMPAPKG